VASFSSRCDGEQRLEAWAVSGVDDELTALRVRARKWSQRVRGGEGKEGKLVGEHMALSTRWNSSSMSARVAELRRLIRWPSSDAREGKRESGEEKSRL
jgi:hypothetical protein